MACTIGVALGIALYFTKTSLTGVPTIESFVSAGCLYLIGEWARRSLGRDRRWQLTG
jgi:hypothetical protein